MQILTNLLELVSIEIYAIDNFNIRGTPFSPRFYTFPHPEVGMAAESFTSQLQNFLILWHTIIFKHWMDKHWQFQIFLVSENSNAEKLFMLFFSPLDWQIRC